MKDQRLPDLSCPRYHQQHLVVHTRHGVLDQQNAEQENSVFRLHQENLSTLVSYRVDANVEFDFIVSAVSHSNSYAELWDKNRGHSVSPNRQTSG